MAAIALGGLGALGWPAAVAGADPVLVDDPTVPVDEAHRLHAESRKETTRLLLVEGTHEDYEGLKRRVGEVLDFVADAMGLRPVPNEPAGTQSGAAMPASSVFSSPL